MLGLVEWAGRRRYGRQPDVLRSKASAQGTGNGTVAESVGDGEGGGHTKTGRQQQAVERQCLLKIRCRVEEMLVMDSRCRVSHGVNAARDSLRLKGKIKSA